MQEKDITLVNNLIKNAENPILICDDDVDGVTSGVLIKSVYPKSKIYVSKVEGPKIKLSALDRILDYLPDLIVILDKPLVEQDFIDQAKIPIIWLDHHPVQNQKRVHYFNSRNFNSEEVLPTSGIVGLLLKREDWLVLLGCVGDWYIPKFYKKLQKEYPDLLPKDPKDPGDIFFKSKFGDVIKRVFFSLRGKPQHAYKIANILDKIKDPYEILDPKTEEGKYIFKKVDSMTKEYNKILNDAKKEATKDEFFLFSYKSATSYTTILANELIYTYPDKVVIVARVDNNGLAKMGIRSPKYKIPKASDLVAKEFGGYSGGHDHAAGGVVKEEYLQDFFKRLKEELKKQH